MHRSVLLSLVCLSLVAGLAGAQEAALPPRPQPLQPAGAAWPAPPAEIPPALVGPAQPAGPVPLVPPYPPPYPPRGVPPAVGDPVGNPSLWVGVEGLAWWVKSQALSVPVLTTGPARLGDAAGNLGAAGTVAVRAPLDYGLAAGLRLYAGGWLDSDNTLGVEGSGFFLQEQSAGFGIADPSGRGNVVINEPLAGATFSTQVSAPGLASGAADVHTTSRFSGAEINALLNVHRDGNWSVRLLGGFRYLDLEETLTVGSATTFLTNMTFTDPLGNTLVRAPAGSTASVVDFFGTRNQFYGGQVGARIEGQLGRWFFSGTGKVAIGATHEVITIDGGTLVVPANAAAVSLLGGNYALGTNSGRYWSNRFAVAPEGQVTVGYQLGAHVRALVGYNFLYLSSVARPGNQVDNVFNGVTRPAAALASSSFWAQGLTFSLQVSY